LLSVALTVIGKLPVCVGVPLSTPADDKVKLVGKVLAVLNVVVPMPPLCVKVWLKGENIVPAVVAGFVTVIVWQLMTKLSVALSLPEFTSPGVVTVAVLESGPSKLGEIVQEAV
jgi:hypothetical protein